jgi:hypothetical protein
MRKSLPESSRSSVFASVYAHHILPFLFISSALIFVSCSSPVSVDILINSLSCAKAYADPRIYQEPQQTLACIPKYRIVAKNRPCIQPHSFYLASFKAIKPRRLTLCSYHIIIDLTLVLYCFHCYFVTRIP